MWSPRGWGAAAAPCDRTGRTQRVSLPATHPVPPRSVRYRTGDASTAFASSYPAHSALDTCVGSRPSWSWSGVRSRRPSAAATPRPKAHPSSVQPARPARHQDWPISGRPGGLRPRRGCGAGLGQAALRQRAWLTPCLHPHSTQPSTLPRDSGDELS